MSIKFKKIFLLLSLELSVCISGTDKKTTETAVFRHLGVREGIIFREK